MRFPVVVDALVFLNDNFSLSHHWRVSAYDSAYLAIAEKLDSEVWTGDCSFYTACRRRGSRVRWIGDYPKAAH